MNNSGPSIEPWGMPHDCKIIAKINPREIEYSYRKFKSQKNNIKLK